MSETISNRKEKAAKLSIISNVVLTIMKLITGLLSGSVGILSEAIHSAIDLAASLVAYFSIKAAAVPADNDHPYGHGKYEDLSGLAEAILIFVAVAIIMHEAITKMLDLEGFHIETGWAIIVMIIAVITNIIVSRYLFKVAKDTDSLALLADAEHLRTDVYTSIGVLISLLLVHFTGYTIIDPITALLVAIFISFIAYKIIRLSIDKLVDISLPKEEEDIIKGILSNYSEEVISVHKFRTRKSGSDRFIDFHLTVESELTIKQGHILCDYIEHDIKKAIPNTYLSIHLEPCTDKCDDCHVFFSAPDSCKRLQIKNLDNNK